MNSHYVIPSTGGGGGSSVALSDKATLEQLNAGTADKWVDAANFKALVDLKLNSALYYNPYSYGSAGRAYGTDFVAGTLNIDIWITAALASGTVAQVASIDKHSGILAISDSTTADGGGRIISPQATATGILLRNGAIYECIYSPSTVVSTSFSYNGFHTTGSVAQPVDGAYFYVAGATVVGRCTRNGTGNTTTTGTSFTLVAGDWYRFRVVVVSSSSVVFQIISENNVLLWSDTITTNIPTLRAVGTGIVAWESTTTAVGTLCLVDALAYVPTLPLLR